MSGLEWVGLIALVICVPIGAITLLSVFAEWWIARKHLHKAILGYYAEKLKNEKPERIRGA